MADEIVKVADVTDEYIAALPKPKTQISAAQAREVVNHLYEDEAANADFLERIKNILASPKIDVAQLAQQVVGWDARNVEVWICSNEKNHDILKSQLRDFNVPVRCVSLNIMVVGDYWIVRNTLKDDKPVREVLAIYEHKEVKDLLSSIQGVGKRYREQTFRLLLSNVQFKFYLVSGSIFYIPNREDRQALTSAIDHLNFLHPTLRVSFTPDAADIARVLANGCKFAAEYADGVEWFVGHPEVEIIKHNCKKKTLDNQPDVWTIWAATVDGSGPAKAEAITKEYPSITHYLSAVQACSSENEKELLLADVRAGKKNVRIGPALSTKFYRCVVPARDMADTDAVLTRPALEVDHKLKAKKRAAEAKGPAKKK